MANFVQTIIVRHRRENRKKCSLRGLEKRPDLTFFTYPRCTLPDLSSYLLLTTDAPPLQPDETKGLMLLDGSWKMAARMERNLPLPTVRRSLPRVQTAYPRRQEEPYGLATVEALFLAYLILGRPVDGLLDHYHWKELFYQEISLYQSCAENGTRDSIPSHATCFPTLLSAAKAHF